MPQISKYKLDKNVENRLFNLFWRSLTKLGSPDETAEFFDDLLTPTEKTMLAKRYTIAVLLAKGYASKQIRTTLNVSFTTIGTVSAWLKNLKPATKKILDRHLKDEAWGQFFDKIGEVFDEIPPHFLERGKDWKKLGREKYRRSLARSARSVLR